MTTRTSALRRGVLSWVARRTAQLLIAVGVLVVVLVALDLLVDEPLRRSIERRTNQKLQGYTARLGEAARRRTETCFAPDASVDKLLALYTAVGAAG